MSRKDAELERATALVDRVKAGERIAEQPADLANAVIYLASHWKKTLREPYMTGVDGAPDWLEFEHRVWSLGEDLRRLLQKKKKWREETRLFDAFSSIAADPEYDKGRQTFVLLLGDFRGDRYHRLLASLLSDDDIDGFAIKALSKTKAGGHVERIRAIEKNATGWKKQAAKTYISKWSG